MLLKMYFVRQFTLAMFTLTRNLSSFPSNDFAVYGYGIKVSDFAFNFYSYLLAGWY